MSKGKNAAVKEMKHIYSVWLNKKTFQCLSVPHSLIFLFNLGIKTENWNWMYPLQYKMKFTEHLREHGDGKNMRREEKCLCILT